MPLSSMTGFASNTAIYETLQIDFSLKSVNSKGLEVRIKVPGDYDGLDLDIKKRISSALVRGSVSGTLTLKPTGESEGSSINVAYLKSLIESVKSVKSETEVNVESLLSLPGVMGHRPAAKLTDGLRDQIMILVDQSVAELTTVRRSEGAEIERVLRACVEEMRSVTDAAANTASQRPAAVEERYKLLLSRLDKGVEGVDPDRLAQEVALLSIKLDVAEELDRLAAHFKAIEAGFNDKKPVGRKFDFLAQELVREANTLCSKSQDKDLTAQGLQLKSLIDRFREQALNIE